MLVKVLRTHVWLIINFKSIFWFKMNKELINLYAMNTECLRGTYLMYQRKSAAGLTENVFFCSPPLQLSTSIICQVTIATLVHYYLSQLTDAVHEATVHSERGHSRHLEIAPCHQLRTIRRWRRWCKTQTSRLQMRSLFASPVKNSTGRQPPFLRSTLATFLKLM